MREKLAKLGVALEDMRRASVFKKAVVAEAVLLAAWILLEDMVNEIDKLKAEKGGTCV